MTLNISQRVVVLLLFLIGLSLKPQRLNALRHEIGLIGVGPMVFAAATLTIAARKYLHLDRFGALAAGRALAVSATAIAKQLKKSAATPKLDVAVAPAQCFWPTT